MTQATQHADELDPSGGLITDIRLPSVLDSGGPLPMDSKTARLAAGELLGEAAAIARPKAAWRLALIRRPPETPNRLEIGGVVFDSPLLLGNLEGLGRVFPFLATEGRELADWAESLPQKRRTAAFIIRYVALKEAERRAERFLAETFGLGSIGAMSPGVLPQWPLSGQRDLFELLDPLPGALEVALRPQSLWMSPDMSSSGMYFETGAGYHNCRLCPLDKCPIRRYERSS